MATRSRSKTAAAASGEGSQKSSGQRLRSRALVITDDEEDSTGNDSASSTTEEENQTPKPGTKTMGRGGKVDTFRTPGTPPSSSRAARLRRGRDHLSQSRRSQRDSESQLEEYDPFDFSAERRLSQEEMVKMGIQLTLVMHGLFHPIRKSDLIKRAMNNQSSDFMEVIEEISDVLWKVYGFRLVGMKSSGTGNVQCHLMEATAFIIVSKYRMHTITEIIFGSGFNCGKKGLSKILVKAVLMLILSCTYMLDRTVDEDYIWELLESLDFRNEFCKKREDLRRVLKTEFVDTLYLSKHEDKTTDQVSVRYGWGFRAEQEVNKYALLKYISQNIMGKSPAQYRIQFESIPERERNRIEAFYEGMMRSGDEEVSVVERPQRKEREREEESSAGDSDAPRSRRRAK